MVAERQGLFKGERGLGDSEREDGEKGFYKKIDWKRGYLKSLAQNCMQ